jgi:hypothetical protein
MRRPLEGSGSVRAGEPTHETAGVGTIVALMLPYVFRANDLLMQSMSLKRQRGCHGEPVGPLESERRSPHPLS